MAQDQGYPFGLRDLKIFQITDEATPTYANGVDVNAAQELTFDITVTEAILRGDDVRKCHHAVKDGADWSLTHGGVDLAAAEAIMGATASDSDASPNELTYLDVKVSTEIPYFGMIGQILDGEDAGDTHVQLFKCKTNAPGPGGFSGGNFHTPTIAGVALPAPVDDDTIVRTLVHQTSCDIPSAWPADPYTSS